MTDKVRYNKELLDFCIKRDSCLLKGEYKYINRETKISYFCVCGKEYKKVFRQLYEISGAYCKECTNQNKQQKYKYTNIVKYGIESTNKLKDVKDKIKASNLKKYGVENPNQRKEVKDKIKATCIEKYGVENPNQSKEVRDKIKATCIEKYGVEYVSQSKQVKDKFKSTCIEKYGVEHPFQVSEISEKASKNSYKIKEVITPSGNKIYLQGYEPHAYKILLETYTEDEILNSRIDVPEIWWVDKEDKKHRYFVDFFIPKDNLMIEVKSMRTYSMDDKQEKIEKTLQASKDSGYNIELWIINEKGNIVKKLN
jgi:hypothetical protein